MRHILTLEKNETSCWLWALGTLCLCFSPLMFQFIWGNHDWLPVLNDAGLSSGLVEGRFSQYLFLNIILAGKILPMLNIFLGSALYTLALVLLCTRFFDFSLQKKSHKFFLAVCASLPYINEIIYFHFITFSLLGWTFVIMLALIAAKQAAKKDCLSNTLLSAALLFLAAGGYPAAANMFAVAACLYAVRQPNIKKLFPFAASFILALSPLPFIYKWLKTHNLMIQLYNTETETLVNLIRKIPQTLSYAVQSLWQPQPFFPLGFKILVILIILLFCLCLNKEYLKKRQIYISLLFIPVLLLALKLPLWLSRQTDGNYYTEHDPISFMIRGDFFALPVLLVFSLLYLQKFCSLQFRNFLLVLSAILLWFNVNLNLSFCKTMLLGFEAENLLIQRITDRIQQHPDYNADTIYSIMQTGEIYFRPKYYVSSTNEKYGYYTLKTPFTRYWLGAEYYNFYAPRDFAANQTPIFPNDISPQMIDFVTSQTAVWPSPNAVYLDTKYCIIALTAEGKRPLTEQFNLIKRQM